MVSGTPRPNNLSNYLLATVMVLVRINPIPTTSGGSKLYSMSIPGSGRVDMVATGWSDESEHHTWNMPFEYDLCSFVSLRKHDKAEDALNRFSSYSSTPQSGYLTMKKLYLGLVSAIITYKYITDTPVEMSHVYHSSESAAWFLSRSSNFVIRTEVYCSYGFLSVVYKRGITCRDIRFDRQPNLLI